MSELPMFPLGSVLFPSMVLPLHVFEPRYRAMTAHCLSGDPVAPEFGVVLIERGSEVGGNDVRTDVGTVAAIREAAHLEDGRWALVAIGTRRIRVTRWLPDEPWPRALVEDLPDEEEPGGSARHAPVWEGEVLPLLRRALALAAELRESAAPATIELAPDPALATFQAAAVGPLGPLDQQRVLSVRRVGERVALLRALLADQIDLLDARLRLG